MNHIIPTLSFCFLGFSQTLILADDWQTASQGDWKANKAESENLEFKDAMASPTAATASFKSILKSFPKKRSAVSISINQSPVWLNWDPIPSLGPKNLRDAPVALRLGEGDYWLFGRYATAKKVKKGAKTPMSRDQKGGLEATLDGFDIPLTTTAYKHQFDAPGAMTKKLGGYHAWQSKDMVNWVHHGSVSDTPAKWMTTAEQVGGKTYFYYDFPNDQDPHLIIDEDLTDGKMGKKMGIAFKDPSHGSDSAIIRSLDGKFHLILENWDPIKASSRAWDSPLASHAVSDDGISNFKLMDPAVDYRTNPTGEFAYFTHPHWHKEDPENFKTNKAKYEIHTPEQEAYGDWAAISIGGQYYLFGDYDPAGVSGSGHMKTVWFTSSDINKPFVKCSTIGSGHPDPDIIFAENQFYLVSQTVDFISPGPWVDGVEVRVGVDIDNDKKIDQWTEWRSIKETYSGVEGFAKQVAKTPAKADLNELPDGFGFQFEIRISDKTKNGSMPILDKVTLTFDQ